MLLLLQIAILVAFIGCIAAALLDMRVRFLRNECSKVCNMVICGLGLAAGIMALIAYYQPAHAKGAILLMIQAILSFALVIYGCAVLLYERFRHS